MTRPSPIDSTHRSTGSASMTIPGPPPYASSSVERCLSLAKSRRSCTRTSSSPCLMPRAITPSAISGSNIRGKIVTKSILIDPLGQVDRHRLRLGCDLRADLRGERHVEFAIAMLHLQQDAAAAFVDLDDSSALVAVRIDEFQANEIVQEVLALIELARFALRNLDAPVAERVDVIDAGELHEHAIAVRACAFDARIACGRFVGRHERDRIELVESIG